MDFFLAIGANNTKNIFVVVSFYQTMTASLSDNPGNVRVCKGLSKNDFNNVTFLLMISQ